MGNFIRTLIQLSKSESLIACHDRDFRGILSNLLREELDECAVEKLRHVPSSEDTRFRRVCLGK